MDVPAKDTEASFAHVPFSRTQSRARDSLVKQRSMAEKASVQVPIEAEVEPEPEPLITEHTPEKEPKKSRASFIRKMVPGRSKSLGAKDESKANEMLKAVQDANNGGKDANGIRGGSVNRASDRRGAHGPNGGNSVKFTDKSPPPKTHRRGASWGANANMRPEMALEPGLVGARRGARAYTSDSQRGQQRPGGLASQSQQRTSFANSSFSLGGDGPAAGEGTPLTAAITNSSPGSALQVNDDPDPFGEAAKARKASVEREQYRQRFDAEMLQYQKQLEMEDMKNKREKMDEQHQKAAAAQVEEQRRKREIERFKEELADADDAPPEVRQLVKSRSQMMNSVQD